MNGIGLSALGLVALVGGLIGGVVVALLGWWAGWATRTEAPAACAVSSVAATALPSVVTIEVPLVTAPDLVSCMALPLAGR